MSRPEESLTVDVVIPVFNEAQALPYLFERLGLVFSVPRLQAAGVDEAHVIFVDDGSTDTSAQVIAEKLQEGFPGTLLRLSRNFGHQQAVSAGLDFADADVVAVVDADLQDPPELIFDMLLRWRDGYDVVYAQRQRRRESLWKRAGYWAFYRTVAYLSDFTVPLDSGDFCLMGRNVVEALKALPEGLRFPRVLRAWVGFNQVGFPYERASRSAGKSKYSLRHLYKLATDGVATASTRVLRLAQLFSFSFAIVAGVFLVLGLVRLSSGVESESGMLLLVLGTLVAAGNFVQMLYLYILGAYVGRTYLEVKRRPPYLLREVVGLRGGKMVGGAVNGAFFGSE